HAVGVGVAVAVVRHLDDEGRAGDGPGGAQGLPFGAPVVEAAGIDRLIHRHGAQRRGPVADRDRGVGGTPAIADPTGRHLVLPRREAGEGPGGRLRRRAGGGSGAGPGQVLLERDRPARPGGGIVRAPARGGTEALVVVVTVGHHPRGAR